MRNIYINQFNAPWSFQLMPYSAGLLKATAKQSPILKNTPIHLIWKREHTANWLQKIIDPSVIAFSTYFWNYHQSLACARAAKQYFPNATIIFGGPSAPTGEASVNTFFRENSFVDISVSGEGELVFCNILEKIVSGDDWRKVEGINYRIGGNVVYGNARTSLKDLSAIASPLLDGTFDQLIQEDSFTGIVWETNRGCPFTCSFCYWGGPDQKVAQHSLEKIYQELEWIAKNKISYVLGADANFGILKRDVQIAQKMAELNRQTGYPKKFVINWVKNATARIFDIVDILKESDIEFLITTSVQSYNQPTLEAVSRKNIRQIGFQKILKEASKRKFNTYSEIILGLPNETYETFRNGLSNVLTEHLHYHFNVYNCIVIPGTKMAEPEYLQKYKIQVRRCEMSRNTKDDSEIEYQDFIVGNSTLPVFDWRRCHTLGFMSKALFGFRIVFYLANYLKREHGMQPVEYLCYLINHAEFNSAISRSKKCIEAIQESILAGGREVTNLPNVEKSLFPEYASLVLLLENKTELYAEIKRLTLDFAAKQSFLIDKNEFNSLLAYQMMKIPTWYEEPIRKIELEYDWEQYFLANKSVNRISNNLMIGDNLTYSSIDDFLLKRTYSSTYFKIAPTITQEFLPKKQSNSQIDRSQRTAISV